MKAAQDAIASANGQFQQEQRPYVWLIVSSENGFNIVEKEDLWLNVGLINYGRSPAIRQQAIGKVFFGPHANAQADAWFANLGTGPHVMAEGETSNIIPPGAPEKGTPFTYVTVRGDHPLTHNEVEHALHDWPVIAALRVQYYDLAGNRYWNDFCQSRAENGSMPRCPKHNEVH